MHKRGDRPVLLGLCACWFRGRSVALVGRHDGGTFQNDDSGGCLVEVSRKDAPGAGEKPLKNAARNLRGIVS